MSTKQQRIAELAGRTPARALSALNQYVDLEWMRAAYANTRKNGASGVDGQTAAEFEQDLEAHLQSLIDGLKSRTYKAPPVKRVYIPKGSGNATRPIGVPTLADKVLQRGVVMLLEPIYETAVFLPCSYGFRPGRSQHDALNALRKAMTRVGGGWVLEVDVSMFFDTLDHNHLRAFIRERVEDGVVRRAIDKWLNAGVRSDDKLMYPTEGTPQGGVISPLLANIYLHTVLDQWFEEVKPRLHADAELVRYADDFVIVFASEADARRVQEVLPKRLAKFGLTAHPEKTRLVNFTRPDRTGDEPGTIDFLGFTHYWGKTRYGGWAVKQRTAAKRLSRSLKSLSRWMRTNRHMPVRWQHEQLVLKVRGHYAYYGRSGNLAALKRFRCEVERLWHKWLGRRNRRPYPWSDFQRLLDRFPLPPARIMRRQRVIANL